MNLATIEDNSFGNLFSLRDLTLYVQLEINNRSLETLFESCPNIEALTLQGEFSNVNFDRFVNLKKLVLYGNIFYDFDYYDLFANICNRLEELYIILKNVNDEIISKLLYDHSFPMLSSLKLSFSKITRVEKKLFDGFSMLQSLDLSHNSKLKTIDKDSFLNLKNLTKLSLFSNDLSEFDPELIFCLKNLEEISLGENKLTFFDLKIMDYIVNINELHLCGNPIVNKQEILDHFKQSEIKLCFA